MKRLLIAMVLLAVLAMGSYALLGRTDASPGSAPELAGAPASADATARGEYLARAADCAACHTLPGSGKLFAGGAAFHLPFGIIYSSNITADPQTGIGGMSDEEFVRAVREGVRRDGAHLYPAHSLYFLHGAESQRRARHQGLLVRAARGAPGGACERSEISVQSALGVGLLEGGVLQEPALRRGSLEAAEWNRGAYLATALGHCGECHTPRNFGVRP